MRTSQRLIRVAIGERTVLGVIVSGCVRLHLGGLNDDLASIVTSSLDLYDLGGLAILLDHLNGSIACEKMRN